MTTIATVADAVEEHFVPYYDHFMPSLKYVMAQATAKEYRLLRGKTIECISLVGLAVGQQKVRHGRRRGGWDLGLVCCGTTGRHFDILFLAHFHSSL